MLKLYNQTASCLSRISTGFLVSADLDIVRCLINLGNIYVHSIYLYIVFDYIFNIRYNITNNIRYRVRNDCISVI